MASFSEDGFACIQLAIGSPSIETSHLDIQARWINEKVASRIPTMLPDMPQLSTFLDA
ncbi:hypothetical protein [Rubellicoccus peritrichatus]|uniref:Uncharacterized protein n=1 Tax=Rubellicoccus peritrichatus TaxID=3080537 RepID=A0AAQ3L7S0_9BACT|nr:hypothetical protein [Puniceicoccus sp. CR14]WOO40227.1 hypothetical protein RZN69_16525 [Puniceicoccus sp. CR14]